MSRFLSFFCVPIIFMGSAFALEEAGWSFEDHPQPSLAEMTEEERGAILTAKRRTSDHEKSCRYSLEVEYAIYLNRYPEFLAAYDERQQVKQWRRHMAQNPGVQSLTCLYQVINSDLKILNASPEIGDYFIFCGKYSREPNNQAEARTKRLIDEMVSYAGFGLEYPVETFSRLSVYINIINIPADLNYYLVSHANNLNTSASLVERLNSLSKRLPEDRVQFLDAAAERRDYQSVVDTLPSCEPKLIWNQ